MVFPPQGKISLSRGIMVLLHTSDWHLGKRLMDRERLPEQAEVLEEIAAVCDERGVELVLVAGDVFDTYLPPAEAEELFFRAVKRLAEGRAVVIISGNHDDGVRLAASSSLAGEEGIYIFGGTNVPAIGAKRKVYAAEADERHIVIRTEKGEEVYINALPYPNEARLKEDKTEESYADKTRRRIERGDEAYDGRMPHVLLSHLFIAGGKVSESERDIALGGARAVPPEYLPDFGYTALGHLHRMQKAGNCGYYSGSLLQYSFDEANTEKCVLLLETQGNQVNLVEKIPLKAGKQLVRLEANGPLEAEELLSRYENCFIELTLHLTAPLTAADTQRLRAANEGLVSLITLVAGSEREEVVLRSRLGAGELFDEFYRSQYGKEPSPDLKREFLLLLEEDA